MRLPEISVVIPTYNRARYVTRAIDSVLAQSLAPAEIIIVDDGSTDETERRLRAYGARLRYLRQENAGVSAARNAGIAAARGRWVAFLDSDDEWLPEKLAVQMSGVSAHPEIIAHVTNVTVVAPTGDQIDYFAARHFAIVLERQPVLVRPLPYVMEWLFFVQGLMARRQALLRAGLFDPMMSIFEDGDLLRRLSLEGPWGVSVQCLTRVFRREEPANLNLSRQYQDRAVCSLAFLTRMHGRLLADERLRRDERAAVRESLSATRFDLGVAQWKAGDRHAGRGNIRGSFWDNPCLKSFVKAASVQLAPRRAIRMIERHRAGTPEFRRSDLQSSGV
jgi:glycosyltransferase involved in cell wall biosynthesis